MSKYEKICLRRNKECTTRSITFLWRFSSWTVFLVSLVYLVFSLYFEPTKTENVKLNDNDNKKAQFVLWLEM